MLLYSDRPKWRALFSYNIIIYLIFGTEYLPVVELLIYLDLYIVQSYIFWGQILVVWWKIILSFLWWRFVSMIYSVTIHRLYMYFYLYCSFVLQQLSQEEMSEDSFFDLLSKFQSRRIDDQRCSFKPTPSEDKPESNEKQLKETGITIDFFIKVTL